MLPLEARQLAGFSFRFLCAQTTDLKNPAELRSMLFRFMQIRRKAFFAPIIPLAQKTGAALCSSFTGGGLILSRESAEYTEHIACISDLGFEGSSCSASFIAASAWSRRCTCSSLHWEKSPWTALSTAAEMTVIDGLISVFADKRRSTAESSFCWQVSADVDGN